MKNRIRLSAALAIVTVVPIGLFARSHRTGADPSTPVGFLATYTGDALWAVLFFFLGRLLFPLASQLHLLTGTLLLTLTIEFGQLWQPPALQWLRAQPGIGFMLGHTFLWSDVCCLIVGGIAAVGIDILIDLNLRNRARS